MCIPCKMKFRISSCLAPAPPDANLFESHDLIIIIFCILPVDACKPMLSTVSRTYEQTLIHSNDSPRKLHCQLVIVSCSRIKDCRKCHLNFSCVLKVSKAKASLICRCKCPIKRIKWLSLVVGLASLISASSVKLSRPRSLPRYLHKKLTHWVLHGSFCHIDT